jgi:hypothetical protein
MVHGLPQGELPGKGGELVRSVQLQEARKPLQSRLSSNKLAAVQAFVPV